MAKDITPRQKSILDFIAGMIEAQGYPPTIQEIGKHFGITSTNGVFDHLKMLERKGFIERSSRARSIQLTQKAIAKLRYQQGSSLPLLGRVAAGHPLLAEENIEAYVPVEPHLATRDAFCLRVRGDSMIEAGILDGDIVVIDRGISPNKGDVVVALIDGEATLKFYYPRDNLIELRPANHQMRSITFHRDEVLIQGVVIELRRRLTTAERK